MARLNIRREWGRDQFLVHHLGAPENMEPAVGVLWSPQALFAPQPSLVHL